MSLGTHWLIDFHGCDSAALKDESRIASSMTAAILEAGGTIVQKAFHQFSPHGVSGVIVIAESHVAIHTWPEHDFAAVDIFTCTQKLDMDAIVKALEIAFGSSRSGIRKLTRGDGDSSPSSPKSHPRPDG